MNMKDNFTTKDLRRLAGITSKSQFPLDQEIGLTHLDLTKIKKHQLSKSQLVQIISDLLDRIDLWQIQMQERNQFASYILTDVAGKLSNPNPVDSDIKTTMQDVEKQLRMATPLTKVKL